MDEFFKISARGSSVRTEVMAGLTTFLTMAYVVAVNPAMLGKAGVPFTAALTATCFGAALMTAVMGLVTNRPVALASGMGLNAVVVFSICLGQGVDWRVAMACVLLEGLAIMILVLCGLREAIMRAIPASLQRAIGIGIGLFIAFIGLKGGMLIVGNESSLITMGAITQPEAIIAILSIVLAVGFTVVKIKGGLLWSILIATLVGIPFGVTPLPSAWNFGLDFSAFAAPLQTTPDGMVALVQVIVQPALLLFVFSMLMSDFFDTMGTVFAVGQKAGFSKENGDVEDMRQILIVDSAAAMAGGFIGASSITCYAESVSGATAGARTGFSNLVIAGAFVLCAFLSPIIGMISSSATCGALVVVGYLMMTEIGEIDWHDPALAIPSFLVIVGIPMTYSITDGIGFGFIFYCFVMLVTGRGRDVKPLMWIASAAFLAAFILV
ncbi:permease [Cryptobacterium curtum DSM 15641]|uniref:Permease n=1 Tax=Cryptobacterium curtum (strain ATCC 700683 / DSM 15641 / CCUG 43107 / 12-3) TaxID=469378 RepID=C7MME1_CRYCD|nr:NCS2 family permease [Cryptobacterium curtum]ACU94081.1 permease [Cryptobacterium curtum DSM 15641]